MVLHKRRHESPKRKGDGSFCIDPLLEQAKAEAAAAKKAALIDKKHKSNRSVISGVLRIRPNKSSESPYMVCDPKKGFTLQVDDTSSYGEDTWAGVLGPQAPLAPTPTPSLLYSVAAPSLARSCPLPPVFSPPIHPLRRHLHFHPSPPSPPHLATTPSPSHHTSLLLPPNRPRSSSLPPHLATTPRPPTTPRSSSLPPHPAHPPSHHISLPQCPQHDVYLTIGLPVVEAVMAGRCAARTGRNVVAPGRRG